MCKEFGTYIVLYTHDNWYMYNFYYNFRMIQNVYKIINLHWTIFNTVDVWDDFRVWLIF